MIAVEAVRLRQEGLLVDGIHLIGWMMVNNGTVLGKVVLGRSTVVNVLVIVGAGSLRLSLMVTH